MWKERALYMINWFNSALLWQENRLFCHFVSMLQHVSMLILQWVSDRAQYVLMLQVRQNIIEFKEARLCCPTRRRGQLWDQTGSTTHSQVAPDAIVGWGLLRTLNQLRLTCNETELIHHWQNLIFSTRPMQMRRCSQGPVVFAKSRQRSRWDRSSSLWRKLLNVAA